MTQTLKLNPAAIVALSLHRSSEKHRPILHNIFIGKDGVGVATNGFTMLAWKDCATSTTPLPDAGYLLALTPDVLKAAKSKKAESLIVAIDGASATWTAVDGYERPVAGPYMSTVSDEQYPDWRRVLPKEVSDTPIEMQPVNAEYVGLFSAASGATGKAPPAVILTATGIDRVVVVTFPNNANAYGLIMPTRFDGETDKLPEWVTTNPAQTPENEAIAA